VALPAEEVEELGALLPLRWEQLEVQPREQAVEAQLLEQESAQEQVRVGQLVRFRLQVQSLEEECLPMEPELAHPRIARRP
jgi:hypothetical protein